MEGHTRTHRPRARLTGHTHLRMTVRVRTARERGNSASPPPIHPAHTPRAALEITDYRQAILRVAQTTLREMIGSSPLRAMLSERQAADLQLKADIGRKTAEWGIAAVSVELRDVAIPAQLQDAMSRQAQAEREKQARIILWSAVQEVARKF